MKVDFTYDIRDKVFIDDLNTVGTIVGFYYGDTGKQYQVTYFLNGEKRVTYLFDGDFQKVRKVVDQRMGFKP